MSHTLIFLHGWLGSPSDWQPVIEALNYPGKTLSIALQDIDKIEYEKTILIGYSMGGRAALQQKNRERYELALILGGHLGLKEEEIPAQIAREKQITEMLQTLCYENYIREWYNQALFETLQITDSFIKTRTSGYAKESLLLFNRYLLSKQPLITPNQRTFFLVGARDIKYKKLYAASIKQEMVREIPNAGHAAHIENPSATAETIKKVLQERNLWQ